MEMAAKWDVQWDAESVVAWVLVLVAHLVEKRVAWKVGLLAEMTAD